MSDSEQSTGKNSAGDEAAVETTDDVPQEQADDTAGDGGSGDDEGPGQGGTRQPGADPEDKEEIEEEREQRLDPENRPDNVEVDNTDREFDAKKGMFTDADGYEEAEEKFPGIGEQGA
jgi:hypothetical protein